MRLCPKYCGKNDALRDIVETFARRKLRNTRFETFEDSYKRSIYHRMAQVCLETTRVKFQCDIRDDPLSQVYAVLTWTGVGLAIFIYTRPKTDEQLAEKVGESNL